MNVYYSKLYVRDVAILKKYGSRYKLVLLRSMRQKGFEIDRHLTKRGKANDTKLENNISRAKSKVLEYALCNDFEWFVTLTLDKTKYNRYDLKTFKKDLSKFINNYKQNNGSKIKYILIPEMHLDGAWHMHGLIKGITENDIKSFDEIQYAPEKLKHKGYYNWISYYKKFGFCSIGKIRNKNKVSTYITKYITKNADNTIKELNAQLYYCSKGLEVSEEIKKGTLESTLEYDYENKYAKIKWFDKKPNIIIT